MKANELRIGNFLDRNGLMEVCKIDGMSHVGKIRIYDHVNKIYIQHTFDLDSFNPIALNEEWLLRFGFEKFLGNNFRIKNLTDEYGILENNGGNYSPHINTTDGWKNIGDDVKYVHQLQNLYFALTGEELTIQL